MWRSLAVLLIASTFNAIAQDTRGSILGRVTDPTGAVVVGASIQVANTDTGVVIGTNSTAVDATVGRIMGFDPARVEYLQFLLNERRDSVNMHKQTLQAFYVSIAVLAVVVLAVVFSIFA